MLYFISVWTPVIRLNSLPEEECLWFHLCLPGSLPCLTVLPSCSSPRLVDTWGNTKIYTSEWMGLVDYGCWSYDWFLKKVVCHIKLRVYLSIKDDFKLFIWAALKYASSRLNKILDKVLLSRFQEMTETKETECVGSVASIFCFWLLSEWLSASFTQMRNIWSKTWATQ